MKKTGKCREPEIEESYFIVLDEFARVFAGCKHGYPHYSDDMDDAKPLQGQGKFDFLNKYSHITLEQMFIEYGGKKGCNRKA